MTVASSSSLDVVISVFAAELRIALSQEYAIKSRWLVSPGNLPLFLYYFESAGALRPIVYGTIMSQWVVAQSAEAKHSPL